MDSNKIIISFTSYPGRIKFVKQVLESLVNQTVDRNLYHIVLVLAIPLFPNKENDLPTDLTEYIESNDIEVIWYERDIRSHKKLIPTLKKYPNNPILITDDDVLRKDWWLEMFMKDHEKYPTDVIAGMCAWKVNKNLQQIACKLVNGKWSPYDVPHGIIKTERYANGLGGTLFPPNTFTDERFFDEDLIMQLSPTSDESWDYCFNVMESRTIRQSSIIYNYTNDEIKEASLNATALHKINNFENLYIKLTNAFPEYKENLFKLLNS